MQVIDNVSFAHKDSYNYASMIHPQDAWEIIDKASIDMSKFKSPLKLPPLSGADLAAHAWSEEEIVCHGILGPPGGGRIGPCLAYIFDMRIRRWYTISANHYEPDIVDPELDDLDDPYWYNILRQTGHRGRDDFNLVEVDPVDGTLSLSFNPKHKGLSRLNLHPPPKESLPGHPHVLYTTLQDRQYLLYSIETCTWKGEQCIFKQPLVQRDVPLLDAQIGMTNRLAHSSHFVHIIAYVVDEDGDMRGILLPWAGVRIDTLPTVRWSYFRDIVDALKDIHALSLSEIEVDGKKEASHGDVFCRNILVRDGVARLIDLDNQGLNYPGDYEAFLNVLLALKDKVEGNVDKSRIGEMEIWLRAGMGFAQMSEKIQDW